VSGRLYAIGDVHGCLPALSGLVNEMNLDKDDTVVTLGDYVGKGADSCGVISYLISLGNHCRLVPLLGNHDFLMLAALDGRLSLESWALHGGQKVLDSYPATAHINRIPVKHHAFLRSCRLFYETESNLFVHARYDPKLRLSETDDATLLWSNIREDLPAAHLSGKKAIVGHTSQKCGNVLNAQHLLCIDTNCCAGGWLTAFEVTSASIIQVDLAGRLRSSSA
jgi:serine/threonine protein phosphatase 1